MISRQPVKGPLYMKRIKGGILGDGCSSLLAATFNSLPMTTFSQNNGVIQLTGVASRHVGHLPDSSITRPRNAGAIQRCDAGTNHRPMTHIVRRASAKISAFGTSLTGTQPRLSRG